MTPELDPTPLADAATLDVIGANDLLAQLRPDSKAGGEAKRALPRYACEDETIWREQMRRAALADHWLGELDDSTERALRAAFTDLPHVSAVIRRLDSGESLRDADLFTLKRFFYHGIALFERAHDLLDAQGEDPASWRELLTTRCDSIHPEAVRSVRFHLSDSLDEDLASARRVRKKLMRTQRAQRAQRDEALRKDYPQIQINLDDSVTLLPEHIEHARADPRLEQRGSRWAIIAALEADEALAQADASLAACEARVRASLSKSLAPDAARIEQAASLLAALDLQLASARLRRELGGCWPRWREEKGASLEDGITPRHPGARPVSIEIASAPLLITGPNMGGKSSLLALVGLCQWCMQRGLPAPARGFSAAPVETIIYTGSDEPDSSRVSSGLSSFGREVRRLVLARERPTPTLWLLDELGRGTHPEEGALLAKEIIESFAQRGDTILASTHFPQLTTMPDVDLWVIAGLSERDTLIDLIDTNSPPAPEELEATLRAAMDYRPHRATHADDLVPRDAHLIAHLLGW